MDPRLARATVFAVVGVAFLVHWVVSDPSDDSPKGGWGYVLAFSGVLLGLAIALVGFARMVGRRRVERWSLVAATGLLSGSLANVVEDGLGYDPAFFWFVASTALVLLGLAGTTIATWRALRGRRRLLALVPAGTLVAIVGYVQVGGALMLLTWLGAAAVAVAWEPRPGTAAVPG